MRSPMVVTYSCPLHQGDTFTNGCCLHQGDKFTSDCCLHQWDAFTNGYCLHQEYNYSPAVVTYTRGIHSPAVVAYTKGIHSPMVVAYTSGMHSPAVVAYTSGMHSPVVVTYTTGIHSPMVVAYTSGMHSPAVVAYTSGMHSPAVVYYNFKSKQRMHTADSDIAMYTVIHNTNLLENFFDWNLCCDVQYTACRVKSAVRCTVGESDSAIYFTIAHPGVRLHLSFPIHKSFVWESPELCSQYNIYQKLNSGVKEIQRCESKPIKKYFFYLSQV